MPRRRDMVTPMGWHSAWRSRQSATPPD